MNAITLNIKNKQMRIVTQTNWEGKIDPMNCSVDSLEAFEVLKQMYPSVNFDPYLNIINRISKYDQEPEKFYHAGQIFDSTYGPLILAQVGPGTLCQLICLNDGNRVYDHARVNIRVLSEITQQEFDTLDPGSKESKIVLMADSIEEYIESRIPKPTPVFNITTANTDELVTELDKRGYIGIKVTNEDLLETLKSRTGLTYKPEDPYPAYAPNSAKK